MVHDARMSVLTWEPSAGSSSTTAFRCNKNAASASHHRAASQPIGHNALSNWLVYICMYIHVYTCICRNAATHDYCIVAGHTSRYGSTTIRSAQEYQALMERDGTYGTLLEAAIAAMLLQVHTLTLARYLYRRSRVEYVVYITISMIEFISVYIVQ